MPKDFDKCYKNGGKVRTIKIGKNKYRHLCWLNGKSYMGNIQKKKKSK